MMRQPPSNPLENPAALGAVITMANEAEIEMDKMSMHQLALLLQCALDLLSAARLLEDGGREEHVAAAAIVGILRAWRKKIDN